MPRGARKAIIEIVPVRSGKRGVAKYKWRFRITFGRKQYEAFAPTKARARREMISQIRQWLALGVGVSVTFLTESGAGYKADYLTDGQMTQEAICAPGSVARLVSEKPKKAKKPAKPSKAKPKKEKKQKRKKASTPAKPGKPSKPAKPAKPSKPSKPAKKRRRGRPQREVSPQMSRKQLARIAYGRGVKIPKGADSATIYAILTGKPVPAPAAPRVPGKPTKPAKPSKTGVVQPRRARKYGPFIAKYFKETDDGRDETKIAQFLASLSKGKLYALEQEFNKPEYDITPSKRAAFARQYAAVAAAGSGARVSAPPPPAPGGIVPPRSPSRPPSVPPPLPPAPPPVPPPVSGGGAPTAVPPRTPVRSPAQPVKPARSPARPEKPGRTIVPPAESADDAAEKAAFEKQLGALFGGG